MNKTMLSILKVLDSRRDSVIGSRELSRRLKDHGVELTERTIRYHLKIMDEKGLTQVFGKEGRKITQKGMEELSNSLVSERVGFIISKIEALSYQTNFDIETQRGDLILNISYIPRRHFKEAVRIMRPIFKSPYVMSDRVKLSHEGDQLGGRTVPEGMVGLGTVCSVTINGILLKSGIPVVSRFGGLLETDDEGQSRFVALISYEGSSLDPLLVFIKSGMTSVREAISHHSGKILASFREIPVVSVPKALEIKEKLKAIGIGGILNIGNPNQPLYEMPVGLDRAGMVVVGGLNPIAALHESGIDTESKAMAVLSEYSELVPFDEII